MRIFVPLGPEESTQLNRLARQEWRTPQQQAALLLAEALKQRLKGEQTEEAVNAAS